MARGVTNAASSTISKSYAEKQCGQYHQKRNCTGTEPAIKMVNIHSVNFNSNHSTILANLNTSSNKAIILVTCKDTGIDGNIMSFNIFTKLFPSATADKLVATKDTTKLRTYNCTTITHLGRCKVEIEKK